MIKERENEYVNRMVGLPWVGGSYDIANGGLDCRGAVAHSFKCIDGIDLPVPLELADYEEVPAALPRSIFACYNEAGDIIHIGRILAGRAYHATGTAEAPGSVCTWPIGVLKRYYSSLGCTIKYYVYAGQ